MNSPPLAVTVTDTDRPLSLVGAGGVYGLGTMRREHHATWAALGATLFVLGSATVLGVLIANAQAPDADLAARWWFRSGFIAAVIVALLGGYITVALFKPLPLPAFRDLPQETPPPPTSFPDVEIEIIKVGTTTVPHPYLPAGTQVIAIYGMRIVNHEPQRPAVLTFRLFQDFQLDDGGAPEVICERFRGDHPDGKHPPAVLPMPMNVAPGFAVSGDIIFVLNDWGGNSTRTPMRLEVEDHLSGSKMDLAPQIGNWCERTT